MKAASPISFLTLKKERRFLLLFRRLEVPELKALRGFNHMALGWYIAADKVQVIEPAFHGANIDIVSIKDLKAMSELVRVVEVDTTVTVGQRLFKEGFQTCATLVQYLMGIDLSVTLVQTLYERLTTYSDEYLSEHGILGVNKWELKQ